MSENLPTNDMPSEESEDTSVLIDLTADDYEDNMKKLLVENNPTNEDSDDAIESKIETFVALFEVHFKARKAVKLHEILFDISIDFNTNLLDFNQRLSQTYGKCIRDLPFGRSFEIWKLFLTKLKIDDKFLIKLLSIFLPHIRCLDDCLPSHLSSQLNDLQNETRDVMRRFSKSLSSNDEELIDILLELYFSFESLITLQMSYNENYLTKNDCIEKIRPIDWFDLSVIYEFVDHFDWKTLFVNIDDLSHKRRQTLVKCLFQKYLFFKIIELNSELTEDQRQIVKSNIDLLLSAMIVNFAVNHLNSFTSHQIISIIQESLSHKNLCLLTDSIASNMIIREDVFDVQQLLTEGSVWESIAFQMAFTGSFWKQMALKLAEKKRKLDEELGTDMLTIIESLATNHSYWFKYATHSPNSTKSKLWLNISDISQRVQQMITTMDGNEVKKIKTPLKMMKIFFHCVPLEYLLPSNQMRCLLSLSLLLFANDFTDEAKSQLLDLILNSILRIFEGVRSVWFFNFIDPSIYLTKFLKVVGSYENHELLKSLVTKFVENIFRNSKQIEELVSKLLENEDQIPFELLIMTETIILKQCLHIMNMLSVPKHLQELRQFCGPLSSQLSHAIHNQIKSNLMSDSNIDSFNSIQVIESFSAIVEFQVSKSTEEHISLKSRWKKLLAKLIDISNNQLVNKTPNESCVKFLILLCGQRTKLANILPENFITDLWQTLSRINKQFLHIVFIVIGG